LTAATSFASDGLIVPTLSDQKFVIGIDCGSQSAKVVICDTVGRVLASAQQPLAPMSRPSPGVVLHPNDDLWDAISNASRAALAAFTGETSAIAAVGLCPIRCCKAFLKADGTLVEPVMSWMDERAYTSYVPSDPSLAYVTTSSGYLGHRFTGAFRDAVANSIEMQWPTDSDTWQWAADDAMINKFGLTRDQLFELQMPGDVIGTVTKAAAAATGIPAGIPVVSTANDKAVEMLGAGKVGPTTALISLGTYIAAMVPGNTNHHSPANFWTNFACMPNQYLYESNGVRRGMWTLSWFLDLLGPEFAERAAAENVSREEYIEREAALVPAGSDGLMTVLDWLAPTDQPFRKGSMLGFDARHNRGHIYRSILEAIALTMKQHVDGMCTELNITLTDIVLSGGGSQSPLFMQIFADVFGVPALRSVGPSGAGLGAAICAAAGAGLYPSIGIAQAQMTSPRESIQPIASNVATYAQMSETVFHSIRTATDPIFQRSFPIFH
jgi:sugar (pentulose or hexulose) kinase